MKNSIDEEGKSCCLIVAWPWQLRPEIGERGGGDRSPQTYIRNTQRQNQDLKQTFSKYQLRIYRYAICVYWSFLASCWQRYNPTFTSTSDKSHSSRRLKRVDFTVQHAKIKATCVIRLMDARRVECARGVISNSPSVCGDCDTEKNKYVSFTLSRRNRSSGKNMCVYLRVQQNSTFPV